jgi:hypothetical protein
MKKGMLRGGGGSLATRDGGKDGQEALASRETKVVEDNMQHVNQLGQKIGITAMTEICQG